MFEKSYVKQSGQMWKFYLFFIGFPAFGVSLVFLALNGVVGEKATVFTFLVLFGLGLALLGFVRGVLLLKCPHCKLRLLWKAVREQTSQNWLLWLVSLERCPKCNAGI